MPWIPNYELVSSGQLLVAAPMTGTYFQPIRRAVFSLAVVAGIGILVRILVGRSWRCGTGVNVLCGYRLGIAGKDGNVGCDIYEIGAGC